MTEITAAASFTEEVLALCRAMQEAARAQDWAGAANLEAARTSLLRTTLAESPALLPAAAWTSLLEQVQVCDSALLAHGENEHAQLSAQLLQFRQGARVRNAYAGSNTD